MAEHELVVHEARMRGEEAKAPEAFDGSRSPQELAEAEALARLAVRVDGLAEERDLGVALAGQLPELLQDLRRAAGSAPGLA